MSTVLCKYKTENSEQLIELLIKNLPNVINVGNEKEKSNFFKLNTIHALKTCKFIQFNSKYRVSFMIFDLDTYNNKNAIETFKNIDSFLDYISIKIGLEPTFITQTNKGYHFAYHLDYHVFLNNRKQLKFLNDVKKAIIDTLGCDIHGSVRNYGIWRNPLLHNYYFSGEINYKLNQFIDLIYQNTSIQKRFDREITVRQVNAKYLIEGNRNKTIFYATLKWAKDRKSLTLDDIFLYSSKFNLLAKKPLDIKEIESISKSVFKYYINNRIYIKTKKDINEGIMGFPKMSNLSEEEYLIELKRRRRLSAERTNDIVDKEKKKELMLNAKKEHIERTKNRNSKKVVKAKNELEKENKKITITAISKLTKLDRKTVKKYMVNLGIK